MHQHHHDHHDHSDHGSRPATAPRSRRWARALALGLVLLGLTALARSIVIVDQAEAVYVTEFGRPVRLIEAPGLHWKWPLQSRRGFDKRLQLDAPPPREMLTRDK